jgi:hypothetical protein
MHGKMFKASLNQESPSLASIFQKESDEIIP